MGLVELVHDAFRPSPPVRASDREIRRSRIAAEEDMERRLAARNSRDRDLILKSVTDGYEEQDKRGDRSERRATLMLAAVGVITTLVGATAGILGKGDLADDTARRIGFGIPLIVVVLCFGLAALYALQVVAAGDQWRRPATPTMLNERVTKVGDQLYEHTVAALIDSATWNQTIANRKADRLRRASRCFGAGLIGLLIVAV